MKKHRCRLWTTMGLLLLGLSTVAAADTNCGRLEVTPIGTLQFGTMTTLDTKTLSLRLAHPGGFFSGDQQGDLRLEKFFFSKTGNFTLSDDQEVIRRKNEFYDLKVTVPASTDTGPFGGQVFIKGFEEVDGKIAAQPTLLCQIGVQGKRQPPVIFSPAVVKFGSVQGGSNSSVAVDSFTNVTLQNLTVTPSTHFTANLSLPNIASGTSAQLLVTVKADAPPGGRITGAVNMNFKTSAGQPFSVSVPVSADKILISKPAPVKPDLTVQIQNHTEAAPPPGENKASVTVTLSIANDSDAPALACEVNVLMDGNLEKTAPVPAIPAHGSQTLDVTFKTAKSGAHVLSAVVDSNNANAEANENNNTAPQVSVNIPG